MIPMSGIRPINIIQPDRFIDQSITIVGPTKGMNATPGLETPRRCPITNAGMLNRTEMTIRTRSHTADAFHSETRWTHRECDSYFCQRSGAGRLRSAPVGHNPNHAVVVAACLQ